MHTKIKKKLKLMFDNFPSKPWIRIIFNCSKVALKFVPRELVIDRLYVQHSEKEVRLLPHLNYPNIKNTLNTFTPLSILMNI